MTKESNSYQDMLKSVETIVEEIGSPKLELDQMVNKIEDGFELIKKMRQRLDDTKMKVENLREQFEN